MRIVSFVAVALLLVSSACSCATAARTKLDQPIFESKSADVAYDGPRSIQIEDFDEAALAPAKSKVQQRIAAGDRELFLRINSYGGSIFAGNDFIQFVSDQKKLYGVKVTCIVDSRAYSMGFVTLQSSACDERWMTESSTLLAHNGYSRTSGGVEQIESDAQMLKALNESMAKVCAKRLGMPLEDYKKKIDGGRDWTMASEEAKTVNAVDRVVQSEDVPPPFTLEAAKSPLQLLLGL